MIVTLAGTITWQRIPRMIVPLDGPIVGVGVVVANMTATVRLAECMFPDVASGFEISVIDHSATVGSDTEKQVGQGWGTNKGASEWDDERAGEELAQKDAAGVDTADPNAVPASENPVAAEDEVVEEAGELEPEEVVKTYDEYLAELAQRQADLGPPTEVRRPNEGGNDKKWAAAKELSRKDEEEGDYFVGEAKDKTRNRERKTKQVLDIEPRFVEPRDPGRGGRGRARGDRGSRGRGERGSRGDRSDRGDDHRGGKSLGAPAITDTRAFPNLGA